MNLILKEFYQINNRIMLFYNAYAVLYSKFIILRKIYPVHLGQG